MKHNYECLHIDVERDDLSKLILHGSWSSLLGEQHQLATSSFSLSSSLLPLASTSSSPPSSPPPTKQMNEEKKANKTATTRAKWLEEVCGGSLPHTSHSSSTSSFLGVAISCRSALDIYLKVMAFAPGSIVILSGINIPEMKTILLAHRLYFMVVDVEFDSLAVNSSQLELILEADSKGQLADSLQIGDVDSAAKINVQPGRVVAVLAAHLYGRRNDIEPLVTLSNKYNIRLIEDCAELFTGPKRYFTNSRADLCFFSFGPIKHSTCGGGCVFTVRDAQVAQKIDLLLKTYPRQRSREYLKKLAQYLTVRSIFNNPLIDSVARSVFSRFKGESGKNETFVALLRAFPPGSMDALRFRPSVLLCAVMDYRFSNFREDLFHKGLKVGDKMCSLLQTHVHNNSWLIPGCKAQFRNFWLFPVCVEFPDLVTAYLQKVGINCYRGSTQLMALQPMLTLPTSPPAAQSSEFVVPKTNVYQWLMDHVLYLPVHRLVPTELLPNLVDALAAAVIDSKRTKSKL